MNQPVPAEENQMIAAQPNQPVQAEENQQNDLKQFNLLDTIGKVR